MITMETAKKDICYQIYRTDSEADYDLLRIYYYQSYEMDDTVEDNYYASILVDKNEAYHPIISKP